MPDELELPELPAVARLDEYFGAWIVESMRFMAAFEQARGTDMRRHVEETRSKGLPSLKELCQRKIRVEMVDSETRNETRSQAGPGAGGGVRMAQSIAVVELVGTLMKQPGSMGEATSTVAARAQLRGALADPEVGAILLLIDSPGGTVSGAFDLAADISRANAQKPVYAFIEDLGASAAYLMATGAEKIFANNETAVVGSIGTIIALVDSSAAAEKKGHKLKVYATGPLKGAGMQGTKITPEQDAYFQKLADETQKSFDAAVMDGRGLDAKALAKVATGGVFMAGEAQALGLIDGIKTWQETIAALSAASLKVSNKDPGAGSGARRAGESPRIEEEIPMDPSTSPAAPALVKGPATLKDLKLALPKSDSAFRETCLEASMTLEQAKDAWIAHQDEQLEKARATEKPAGVKPLGAGKPATPQAEGGQTGRAAIEAAAAGFRATGMDRAKAWARACRENEAARQQMVEEHNAVHKGGPARPTQ